MKHKESLRLLMCVGMSVREGIDEECACMERMEEEESYKKYYLLSHVRNTHIFI